MPAPLPVPAPGGATSVAYDLIAIGSGPAGQGAALQAAKLGKRAAVVERQRVLGGASANTGTMPSKTLRTAILERMGMSQGVYGRPYRPDSEIDVDDLLWRTQLVIEHEHGAVQDKLRRAGVDVLWGAASFLDPHTLEIASPEGSFRVSADHIVIAVGTDASRPAEVEFDGRTVLDADGILGLSRIPRTLTVVGAGVVGLEYTSMAAALGTRVSLVDRRRQLLDFVDDEIVEALRYYLGGVGVVFRLGDDVESVKRTRRGVVTRLHSGERIRSELVLYTGGRRGATNGLTLEAAGLVAQACGRISVGPDLRTAERHIFAAGDVVGDPNLAATSMEQGRLAALTAFGENASSSSVLLPNGIFTIPEISYVGSTEQALSESGVPHVSGRGRYRDVARGEIAGDRSGLVKVLADPASRKLLGVHIFGTSATELIHIGQAVMAAGLPVDYLAEAVFNVPTFADAYKLAALDAAGRIADLTALDA